MGRCYIDQTKFSFLWPLRTRDLFQKRELISPDVQQELQTHQQVWGLRLSAMRAMHGRLSAMQTMHGFGAHIQNVCACVLQ